jgi:hypothetical protein
LKNTQERFNVGALRDFGNYDVYDINAIAVLHPINLRAVQKIPGPHLNFNM